MSQIGVPPRKFTAEFKAQVVDFAVGRNGNEPHGITATAREFGVDKASVSGWIKADGLDPAEVAARSTNRTRSANEASAVSRRAQMEQAKATLTQALITIASHAAQAEIQYLRGERRVTRRVDSETNATIGYENVRLSEVTGSRHKAIHDLMLLTDQATERHDIRPSTTDMFKLRDDLAARRQAALDADIVDTTTTDDNVAN